MDYVDWIMGEPLIFDEASGLSIEEWDPAALQWLLENDAIVRQFGIDRAALEKIATNDVELRLFSVDTF